jgi:hypothetical protein
MRQTGRQEREREKEKRDREEKRQRERQYFHRILYGNNRDRGFIHLKKQNFVLI